jgi:mRNA interferase MazF
VKRGELYTAAARGTFTGKPRPVLVIQDDRLDGTPSITVLPADHQRGSCAPDQNPDPA